MKKVIELLAKLRKQEIKLILKGDDLEIISYKNKISQDQIHEIKLIKDQIILYLESNNKDRSEYTSSIPKIESNLQNYPVSNAQYRLWLASQNEEGSVAYNTPNTVFLDGNYNIDCFQKALHSVIERHEILRTVFKITDTGEVRQYISSLEETKFSIDFKDYRYEEDPEFSCDAYVTEDSYKLFDLEKGPLLRASLLQISDNRYIFYYNMHHIIGDGVSMEILSRDMMTYYKAFVTNTFPDITPLRIQYKDYAVWQLDQLNSSSFQSHKEYWLSKFRNEVTVLDLPTKKKRLPVKTYKGKGIGTYISPEMTSKLRDFTTERGGSLFMGLLAVWKVLIYRYTGQTDITIGNPVAGRDHPDLEDQIGFYINILPLRNKINPDHNFIQLFDQIKENTLDAFDHQMYPFDRLLEDLNLVRNTSRSPLFDMKMDYHGISENGLVFNDNQDLGSCMVKFDLEIDPTEIAGGINMMFKYNTDVYDHGMIEKFILHYQSLLSCLLSDPIKSINDVHYLSKGETVQLLDDFNSVKIDIPTDKTMVDLFLDNVENHPNNLAVVFGETSLTYKELDEKSNRLAHYLISEKATNKGDFIGIHLDIGLDYMISLLGILKAGCAYVSIDTGYPSGRKRYLLDNSSIGVVITNTTYMFEIDFYEGELFAIDVELDSFQGDNFDINLSCPDDLAYVLYTSGSTGVPKGVMITHGNLLDYLSGLIASLGLDKGIYSYGLMSTPSADLGNTVLFGSLSTGGVLHLFSREMVMDVYSLISYFDTNPIDIIKMVPSHWYSLCSGDGIFLPDRSIIFGGEKLTNGVLDKIKESNSGVAVYNHYGPTETTVGKLIHKVDLDRDYTNIPIGKPFSNSGVYVLDSNMHLVPIGVVGELYIDGLGVSQGYLNNADLTTETFVSHPFNEGARMYKTGDLARWSEEGTIEFMGRADDQVKIRGHRVEVKEIESILNELDHISQSLVISQSDDSGSIRLIAYIVSDEAVLDIMGIDDALRGDLPDYMIPSVYEKLDAIPLTENGKVDYKALPKVTDGVVGPAREYVGPETDEEKALVAAWESVLKKERVSIKDNFYQLGGDSIKSLQVVARLRQYGFVLKVGDILGTPVLQEMIPMMEKVGSFIDQSEVEGEVILTPIQNYLFSSPNIPAPHHFNQSVLLKSKEGLDTKILADSISHLVRHHDALRMVYTQENGQWKQYNRKYTEDCYQVYYDDLREDKNALVTMGELCNKIQSSFDLAQGPLFVVGHFKVPDGDRLALICHHSVVDGVSWRILLEDLSSLYSQYQKEEELTLPLKTDSFQKWSLFQQEYAQSNTLRKERAYWEDMLAKDIPEFPINEVKQNDLIKSNKQVSFSLSRDMTSAIKTKIHHAYNTEINDVLLTALGLAILDVLGVNQSVLNMEGHGREDIIDGLDISRTVGWFTSHYPLVLEVSNSKDVIENLIKVKDDLRKIPNKGIGYGIVKYLTEGFSKELKQTIKFNYLGEFDNNPGGDNESPIFEYGSEYIGDWKDKRNGDDILLDISGMIASGILNITISYNPSLFEDEKIKSLIDAYQNHLTLLIESLATIKENHVTPSDLIFSDLTIEELDVLNADGTLENVYQLSPSQKGLYFHWLSSDDPRLYLTQFSYRIKIAALKAEHFQKAYDKLIEHYAILRTSFTSKFQNTLLQIVQKDIPSRFNHEKCLDGMSIDEKNFWVEERKISDQLKGFNLEEPSQMRLTVLDLGNELYEFIWSYHHVVMDGWCTSILVNDYYKILQSIANDIDPKLPMSRPFSDYIQWLNKVGEEDTLTYWKDYLSGYNNVVEIPSKTTKLSNQKFENLEETLEISGGLYQKMDALCNNIGVTHYTFIQAVWGYLLSKYNDFQDVVFGSIVSGRPPNLEGVEDMVGLFMNTIPVRVNYKSKERIVDLLKKTQDDAITGLSHQYMSLAKVQGQSELGISLINHVMVFENYPIQELIEEQLGGKGHQGEKILELESTDLNKVQMNYDFSIIVKVYSDSLKLHFFYNGNRYDKTLIKKIGVHFQNVVKSFVQQPDQFLKDVDYLSKKEKHELLKEFNTTKIDYPFDKTVVDLFRKQVQNSPDATALIFKEKTLTYRELDEKSNQVAHYLHKKGVTAEYLIPICVKRSTDMIIGILGVLKAGGAYVPIDPAYPKQRIDFIIEDTDAKLILTTKKLEKQFQTYESSLNIICLDGLSTLDEELSIQPVESPVSPTQLAYLIYTSGSSGKPKGVKIEHKALMNFLFSMRDYLDFDEHLKLLSLTTFTFDISILEFLSPLLLGGELVLISDTDSKNPDYVAQVIKETNPTCIQATPSHWQMLINEDWGDSKNITLLSGGESISEELKEQLVSKSNNVWNLYGPTETTIWSCIQKLEKEEKVTIGKPIANTQIYILDEHLSLTSRGAVGEICIGGLGLSRGYLNRPELTQEKFVTHPFVEGEKIYRTGDLGRWLPNGEIEFKGRKDYQVKIRGYRIELGEIESVLSTKEEIETAIVVAVESTSGDKDLVAYYTSSVAIELPELREYLQNYLPSFMIPSYFIEIEEFPLTANGKINKKALLKPEELELVGSTEYVAPNNEIEKKLVAIWEKVLGREQVGVKDDFFDLGGHSLKVIRLINEYHKVFDVKLTIENVFSNRQLETHTALLFSSEKRDHKLIPVIPESSSYPISDAQRRLWVLSQFKGGSASYNMPSSLSLNDNFNISNFKKSIMSVLDRHEILRTVFREDLDGVVHQVILDVNNIGLEIKEENYTQLHDPEEQAKRYIEEDSYTPFDLKEGPLLRISLLQVSDSDYVFYFNMHHIISDGWSMRVLARDVMTYYDHYSTGSHLELSPLRIQYKDYASWQQAQLGTNEYKIHRNYWLDKFSGNPSLIDLPTDKTRPLMKTHNGRHLSTYFGTEDTHLIRDYIEENEGTLFMFLLSSLKVLLHRYTGEEDIIVGSPIAGRDHSDLEDQIGFYTNTLPIRTNIIGSTTFEKLYENVKQELLESYSHQIYPFDRLVEELDLIRDTGRSALFDILVILQNLDENIDISEIHKEDIGLIKDHGNVMSRFDIEFNFKEEGECLRLDLTYNTDVYDDEMIRGFISHYQKLIKLLITERERCINEIDYLQDEERKELLYDFNSTFLDYPDDKTVIDLFEEQVLKTPNKVALVHKGKKLSYKKIDELSNQLAYRLRSKNIIGACVGVILDRSEDFVISMLAIMRLGKIYVPIDLNYPLERIKYILKDSQITHIVGDLNLEIVEELNDVYDIIPVRSFDKLNAPSKINHSKITEDAFVIYTSGSTGIPKGVVQTHKMLKNLILWDFSVDGIRRDLKCLQYTSFSFDVSLQDVYGVLLNGGELHLVSEQLKLDFISLKDYIISESIEVLAFPYAAMIGFFNVNAAEDFTGNKIQQIVSAGEQLILTEGLNEFLKMNPSVNLHNHYGPSETHVVTSYTYQKLTDVYKDRKDVLIGKPISNTSVYIVNDSHVLQPKGVTGEIYIGGAGLASGYLNREDLTKERFIINPFEEGELVYKTGDLGKWLPDGNIEFLGRIDDQVKIRGYRIELSEIESALDQIKTIKQSIVLAKEDNKGNKQLTAYIVSDEKNDRLKIQDYLRTKLPDYMVPRSYVILKEMPLTPNGKVDKKSLPDPDRSTFERRKYVPPTTEIEIKLTKIWQEVLSIEEIGVKDHFFELGGNSLDAIKVISKMRKELDLEIDIQILFQFNTIADLAFQIGFSLNQKAIKKENKTLNEIKI